MNQAANFDKLTRIYRWMEYLSFGPLLMHSRNQFLPQMLTARHALVLGDGDGRFTAALLRANQSIHIDAVDVSPAMLNALLQAAGAGASRVQTHCVDLRNWQPHKAKYDLVVSHFLLDCFSTEEVTKLIVRILPNLKSVATWVLSEFAIPEKKIARIFARLLVNFLYSAFGLLTGLQIRKLPDHATALKANGFDLIMANAQLFGVLQSELWQYSQRA